MNRGNRRLRPLTEDTSPSAANETGLSVMLDHRSHDQVISGEKA